MTHSGTTRTHWPMNLLGHPHVLAVFGIVRQVARTVLRWLTRNLLYHVSRGGRHKATWATLTSSRTLSIPWLNLQQVDQHMKGQERVLYPKKCLSIGPWCWFSELLLIPDCSWQLTTKRRKSLSFCFTATFINNAVAYENLNLKQGLAIVIYLYGSFSDLPFWFTLNIWTNTVSLMHQLHQPWQSLMTLTASTNFLMSHVHKRWMTHLGQLTVQGFPVTTLHTHGYPCSSFALRWAKEFWGQSPNQWPSRNAMRTQAGNSMHVSCSGVMILFILTQVIMDSDILALQRVKVKRLRLMNRNHRHQGDNVCQGVFLPGSSKYKAATCDGSKRLRLNWGWADHPKHEQHKLVQHNHVDLISVVYCCNAKR